jgi:hypothetical protein
MSAQLRQPTGSAAGGEYATTARPEADLTLPAPAGDHLQRLTDLYTGDYAPAHAAAVAQGVLDQYTAKGVDPALLVDYLQRHRHDRRYEHDGDLTALAAGQLTMADVEEMTARFPERDDAWRVLRAGVSPERPGHLAELGVKHASTVAVMAPMADQTVANWLHTLAENPGLNRWVGRADQLGALHATGIGADRAAGYLEHGIDASTALAHPHLGPATLAAYATAAKMDTGPAADRLDAGLDVDVAAAYGPRISAEHATALHDAGVPGKVARSLRARGGDLTPAHIVELVAAGISSGPQYAAWTDALANPQRSREPDPETVPITTLAAAGLTPAQVTGYVKNGFAATEWVPLHQAGIGDIKPWSAAGLERRAQSPAHRGADSATVGTALAAFAAAGGTPDRLGELSRAGVPVHQAVDFLSSTDPWTDGQPLRDAAMADEARMRKTWGTMAADPTPWRWTKDTYKRGATP